MSRGGRRLALVAAVLLLVVGALLWREQLRRQQARAELERIAALRESSAPPIRHVDRADALFAATLPRAGGGGEVALSTLRGRLLVVNFWASWCPPCIAEMPGLSQFARQHPDVRLVGIAVDEPKPVSDFLQRSPVSYPVLVAGDRGVDLIDALGDVQHDLPYTVVIGADGRIVAQHLGRIDPAALQRLVERR